MYVSSQILEDFSEISINYSSSPHFSTLTFCVEQWHGLTVHLLCFLCSFGSYCFLYHMHFFSQTLSSKAFWSICAFLQLLFIAPGSCDKNILPRCSLSTVTRISLASQNPKMKIFENKILFPLALGIQSTSLGYSPQGYH